MLLAQRDHDAVVGRRCLQLEIERAAETLAQREPPRAVDACAERRMDDELHAARLVEETLGNDARARRHRAERRTSILDVCDGLLRAEPVEAALALQVVRCRRCAAVVDGLRDAFAQAPDLLRQLERPPGRLAVPKGDRRWRAVRIEDAHASRLDAPYAP